jgi:hypothetical protein
VDDSEHGRGADRSGKPGERDRRDHSTPAEVELEAAARRRLERADPLPQWFGRDRPSCLQLRGELLEAVVY